MKNLEEIKKEAQYCLNCKSKPCSIKGCPLGNNIPEFIREIKLDNLEGAYEILCQTTVLPGICGKICPHMKQCQANCIRGIKGKPVKIGELESFVFEKFKDHENSLINLYKKDINNNLKNKKVAIIGGGVTGLTCAAFLAMEGIHITIYEKYEYLGGLLIHGIPEFRLDRKTISKSINKILKFGIEVKYNQKLGDNISLKELNKEYDAIFLGMGANCSSKLKIKGENLLGVYGGNELLEYKLHPNYKEKKVAIIGGGNVAMDCARTIKRLGAKEVNVIYRRSREEMPAEDKEIEEAINEGVKFLFKNNILEIIGNGKVEKVQLIKTELIKKEDDSRLYPVNIEGSNYLIDVDYVIVAVGANVDLEVSNLGLKQNKWGNIEINEKYQTSNPKIFAGGDLIGKKSTVAWASYFGREAAKEILKSIV